MGGGLAALTMRERDEALRKSEEACVRAEKADLEIKKLEVSLAKVTKERAEAQAEATRAATEMKAMVKKVADAEARIAQATEAASGKGRRSIAESAAIGTPDKTKPMKAMAEMMKNPAMREMVRAAATGAARSSVWKSLQSLPAQRRGESQFQATHHRANGSRDGYGPQIHGGQYHEARARCRFEGDDRFQGCQRCQDQNFPQQR
jgi:hypothetical protein